MYTSISETLHAVGMTLHAFLGLDLHLAIDSKVLKKLFAETIALLLLMMSSRHARQHQNGLLENWKGVDVFLKKLEKDCKLPTNFHHAQPMMLEPWLATNLNLYGPRPFHDWLNNWCALYKSKLTHCLQGRPMHDTLCPQLSSEQPLPPNIKIAEISTWCRSTLPWKWCSQMYFNIWSRNGWSSLNLSSRPRRFRI